MSLDRLGSKYGCHRNTVRSRLRWLGIKLRPHNAPIMSAVDVECAVVMYILGYSTNDIARAMRFAQPTIRGALINAKVTLRSPGEAIGLAKRRRVSPESFTLVRAQRGADLRST